VVGNYISNSHASVVVSRRAAAFVRNRTAHPSAPHASLVEMSFSSSSKSRSKARMKASVSNVMSVNAVYFPNYKIYEGYTPASVNYGCVNIIYYAFASINPSDGLVFVRKLNMRRFGYPP